MITYSAEVIDVAGNSVKIVAYEGEYADIFVEHETNGDELNLDADALQDLSKAAWTISALMKAIKEEPQRGRGNK